MKLADSIILITGAAGGIGSKISTKLAREKANLILVDRDKKSIKKLKDELKDFVNACYIIGDIRDISTQDKIIDASISRYGRVDCLINSAAISVSKYLTDIPDSVISEIVDTGLKALISLSKKAIKEMEKQKSGIIINFSSLAGKHTSPRLLPYNAVKSAVIAFTEGIVKEAEVKRSGITAYAICPGSVLTNMHYQMTAQQYGVEPKEVKKSLGTDNPIGTPLENLLMPEEVADKVINLLAGRIRIGKGSCLEIRK